MNKAVESKSAKLAFRDQTMLRLLEVLNKELQTLPAKLRAEMAMNVLTMLNVNLVMYICEDNQDDARELFFTMSEHVVRAIALAEVHKTIKLTLPTHAH